MPLRRRLVAGSAIAVALALLLPSTVASVHASSTPSTEVVWVEFDTFWWIGPLDLIVRSSDPLDVPLDRGSVTITASTKVMITGSPLLIGIEPQTWRAQLVGTDAVLEPGTRLSIGPPTDEFGSCTADPAPDPCMLNGKLFRKALVLNR